MLNKSTIIQLEDIKIDLFEYIDKNSDILKKQYLNIVFEISNLKINKQSFRKSLEYNGHSLWEMSLVHEKNIYKNEYIFKTIKYLALKTIISKNSNKKIKITSLEKDLENILKKNFTNLSIEFEKSHLSLREKFKNILLKNILFNHIYFLYFFLKNCNFSKIKDIKFSKKKYIIFSYFTHYDSLKFSNKVFYPKQWSNLWEILSENKNFLQLFLPNKKFKFFYQIKNFIIKKKIENLNYKNFLNTNIYFEYYNLIKRDFKKLMLKINFNEIESLFKDNKNYEFFFKINKELFISSFSGYTLLQNLLWIKLFDNVLSNIPKHDYGIFLYENQPWEKALITSWKKFQNGKLIGYSHTTINYWHLNYFNDPNYNLSEDFEKYSPNLIAVSSEISKNFLIKQSIKPEKIIEVEALRYLWILEKSKKKLENKNKKILFLGDYKESTNKKLLNVLNESKLDLINSGFELSFKSHPAKSIKIFDTRINLINEDLESLVDKYQYVVSSNTTSAIIEVLSCGINTLLFKDKNNFDLSPLKNTIIEKEINFFYSKQDFLNKIMVSKNDVKPIYYYYLDRNIIKWKKILEIEN